MSDIYIVDVEPGDAVSSAARTRELVTLTRAPSVAFMATAVPNGENLADRLEDWVGRFSVLQQGLAGLPVSVGILVQALIGHGDRQQTVEAVPYQKIVGDDGVECRESFCPLDEGFQAYTRTLIQSLARAAPAFMMIDDDFRIAFHSPANKGCMCPLHLRRFSELTGTKWTRESLLSTLRDPKRTDTRIRWEEVKRDSLVELAAVIRSAIDAVDPSIPGSLCTVIAEAHFAAPIAEALAGRHQPLVRIHNATYLENGHKGFATLLTRTRHQIARLRPDTIVLTEADTCPHSRYSLSVKTNFAHITATTLYGCHGAKYWFVKGDEEGAEDTAPFAEMLSRARPFFDEVAKIRDCADWIGPRVAARMEEVYRKPWDQQRPLESPSDDWGSRVFGRMGIAFAVTDAPAASIATPCAMSGTAPFGFDDKEILGALRGPVLLDGEAAWHLCERGFSKHLGVRVDRATSAATAELMHVIPESDRTTETSTGLLGGGRYLLEVTSPSTRVVASFVSGSRGRYTKGTPALSWHENESGGRVAVYGLSMKANIEWVFFNRKRKRQLLETLTWIGRGTGPVVAETDLDAVLLHARDRSDAALQYIALLDLNPDTVEGFTFRLPGSNVATVERLSTSGRWQRIGFTTDGDRVRCVVDAPTMEPLILRLKS